MYDLSIITRDADSPEPIIKYYFNKFSNAVLAAEEIATRSDKNPVNSWILTANQIYMLNSDYKFEITHLIGVKSDDYEITDENKDWKKNI